MPRDNRANIGAAGNSARPEFANRHRHLEHRTMSTRTMLVGLFALSAVVMMASAPSLARPIAKPAAGRDATIHRCNVLARRLYTETSWDMIQWDLINACVASAGYEP